MLYFFGAMLFLTVVTIFYIESDENKSLDELAHDLLEDFESIGEMSIDEKVVAYDAWKVRVSRYRERKLGGESYSK
ncbi:hypothetical protein EAG18_11395 [Pseudoalteromonas sp. J010]|uniref:hypothetical protein n=1 Tax=Pseudoalteromonas sp. J010 TaxID=998465 RepID=UPI000F648ECB|nr:hypothetical protein [Pseudoalteromonas sp. J010]RRS08594.1 hypothetical protein EAG18_11395 [Pseudoalteromonas sp. J010]